MLGRDKVRRGVLSLTLFMLLFALAANVIPVADLDGISHQSTVVVSEPERRGMSVAGTPHDPIVIDGDIDFAATALAEGWPGDGSAENPYIIDGLDIDQDGEVGPCISISNTWVSFIVSRCKLTGAKIPIGAGIYLYDASNALLTNNTCTSNKVGIYLDSLDSNTVANNTCTSNGHYGIYLHESDSNTVANNTCTSNGFGIFVYSSNLNNVANNTCTSNSDGICLYESDSNTVTNNTFTSNSDGISLDDSDSNTVTNNTCTSNNDGICLYESDSNTVSDNTCTSNWFGICLEFSNSNTLSDNICTSNTVWGIGLADSDSNTVTNNTCTSNAFWGISLDDSDSNTVTNNTCTSNNDGIFVYSFSNSNTVANNTFTSNNNGISLADSDSNTVTNNTCTSNNYGIFVYGQSHYNDILWNVFADNTQNAMDDWGDNTFRYNFWSDYTGTDANGDGIGDTAYMFSFNSDPYPLMYQPILRWIEPPMDQSVEFEHLFHYELNILYYGPLICSISDTTRFSIDNQGVVESTGILPIGEYDLQVDVTNIYGFSITGTFSVRVSVDASNPPGWLTIPIDQSLAYGEKFEYQLIAIDPSGIDYWTLNDTTHFTLTVSFYSGGSTARITNNSVLGLGSYGLNITVYDIFGNVLSGTFKVTVTQEQVRKPTQITDNGYNDVRPQIDNGMVTWMGYDGIDYEIFLWDGTMHQLTDNGYNDQNAQIDNGMVTWQGWDGYDFEIFLWDGTVHQLTDNGYDDYFPQIDNGMVTWQSLDGYDFEIFLWDGTVHQLTDNGYGVLRPQIDNGMVTWEGYDGIDWEIFLWDGTVHQLTDNGYDDYGSQIDNGMVTWFGYDGSDDEIFLWDGTVHQLTDNGDDEYRPQIDNGMVTWRGWDGIDWEIFLWDGTVHQLTDNGDDDYLPQIDNGMVTWYGWDGIDWEIFLWDGTVHQLTDNSYDDGRPQIDNGMVAWYGWDGSDYEIFLWGEPPATPQLELKLSGEFDFLLKEEIHLQLAALLTDKDTGAPVSGATVTFDIYDPDGAILVSGTLVEDMTNLGVYIYVMPDTMKKLKLPKGIYLVYARATLPSGAQAVDMIQFHIDPPGAGSTSNLLTEALVAGSVLGVAAVAALRSFRRRKTRLLSIPS